MVDEAIDTAIGETPSGTHDGRCNCESSYCLHHRDGMCPNPVTGRYTMDMVGPVCDLCAHNVVHSGGGQYIHQMHDVNAPAHQGAAQNPAEQNDDSGREIACPECGGSGKQVNGEKCPKCRGKGKVHNFGNSMLDQLS